MARYGGIITAALLISACSASPKSNMAGSDQASLTDKTINFSTSYRPQEKGWGTGYDVTIGATSSQTSTTHNSLKVLHIYQVLQENDFFALNRKYAPGGSNCSQYEFHAPHYQISIQINDIEHSVFWDMGCNFKEYNKLLKAKQDIEHLLKIANKKHHAS